MNKESINWKNRLTWIIIGAIAGAFFGALFAGPVNKLNNLWLEKRPDSTLFQIVLGIGSLVIVENAGEAMDQIRLEIELDEDQLIEYLMFQEPDNVEITWGGIGFPDVHLVINEVWPNSSQFIEVTPSVEINEPIKLKGYSLVTGVIEEKAPLNFSSLTNTVSP